MSSSDGRIAGLIPVSCSHVLAYSDEIMKPTPSLPGEAISVNVQNVWSALLL